MPLARFLAIIVTCLGAGSTATLYLGAKIDSVREDVLREVRAEGWTVRDQRIWATKLARDNRPLLLDVPDVDEVRAR